MSIPYLYPKPWVKLTLTVDGSGVWVNLAHIEQINPAVGGGSALYWDEVSLHVKECPEAILFTQIDLPKHDTNSTCL